MIALEEGAEEGGTTLRPDGEDTALAKGEEELIEVEAAGITLTEEDLGTGNGDRAAPIGVRIRRRGNHDVTRLLEEGSVRRGSATRVEDDAERLAGREFAAGPCGQGRVISDNRAAADHDRINPRAFVVRPVTGNVAGDPPGIAGRSSRSPIEARGELGYDIRQARLAVLDVVAEQLCAFSGAVTDLDLDTVAPEKGHAVATNGWIGVFDGDNDAANTCIDERPGTRWCALAGEGEAGFKRDVDVRTAGEFPGRCECSRLRVRATGWRCRTNTDEPSLANDDRTNAGVRAGCTADRPCGIKCALHKRGRFAHEISLGAMSPRVSAAVCRAKTTRAGPAYRGCAP